MDKAVEKSILQFCVKQIQKNFTPFVVKEGMLTTFVEFKVVTTPKGTSTLLVFNIDGHEVNFTWHRFTKKVGYRFLPTEGLGALLYGVTEFENLVDIVTKFFAIPREVKFIEYEEGFSDINFI
jgi:hypothetical protein